jgi:hypothetical protein
MERMPGPNAVTHGRTARLDIWRWLVAIEISWQILQFRNRLLLVPPHSSAPRNNIIFARKLTENMMKLHHLIKAFRFFPSFLVDDFGISEVDNDWFTTCSLVRRCRSCIVNLLEVHDMKFCKQNKNELGRPPLRVSSNILPYLYV